MYCGKVNVHHRSLCIVKFSKKSGNESAHITEEVENTDSVQYVSEEPGLISCHKTDFYANSDNRSERKRKH